MTDVCRLFDQKRRNDLALGVGVVTDGAVIVPTRIHSGERLHASGGGEVLLFMNAAPKFVSIASPD